MDLNKGISTPIAIIIIVICAALAGGIAVWQYYLKLPETKLLITPKVKEEVIIATDKTEYRRGENISMNAKFAGNIYVFSDGNWSIYKQKDNSWEKIEKSTGCSSYLSCEEINLDKIKDCNFPICEAPAWYKIDELHPYAQWTWNQKYYTGERKSYRCRWGNQIIDHKCLVYSQVRAGKYKIRFEYTLGIQNKVVREKVDIKYAEKEIIIK